MSPGPAIPADPPSVLEGGIWRWTVIVLYLVASAATFAPGFRHDLVWIPELAWAANVTIILAAIALARARAPLRLQLALAFAAPALYVAFLSILGAYSGESRVWEHVRILGVLLYSQFLGSLVAFAIALVFHRTDRQREAVARPVFSRTFGGLGWGLAAMGLYMHGFGLAVTYWSDSQRYLDGLPLSILGAAFMVGWFAAPLWVVGATALLLSACVRKQRPASADVAVFLLVLGLFGLLVLQSLAD